MPAGYSKKSLIDKLGVKEESSIAILNAPRDYTRTLGKLPGSVNVNKRLPPAPGRTAAALDFIQFFCRTLGDLEKQFPALKSSLAQNGSLWISWPKGSAKVETDLNENIVREVGLRHGLVDVKVCAVDETWSGLKFVRRVKDRK